MDVACVQRKIAAALDHEGRTGRLATQVRQFCGMRGLQLTPAQIDQMIGWAAAYVAQVPMIMEAAQKAAVAAGVQEPMGCLLEIATRYWGEPNDVFPDHWGLQGIIDDAYFTLSVIQTASDAFAAKTGRPLLGQDYTAVNFEMRQLIGEPAASTLDALVAQATGQPAFGPAMIGMGGVRSFVSELPLTDHDIDCLLAERGIFL